jgi:site-specific DNA-methyltransferase (adenine-specific)
MKIEQLAIKEIKPYERNAKKHDERQIKNVMQSIKNYGIVQPLVVDKDNVLIIGHCRLIASKRLKLKEVPVVRMNELTQEQVDKLRLLDNKLNESEWDLDLLAEDIPTLDFSDFDIDWGLPEDIEENTEIEEDEAPEPPTEPKAKLGDLYILGNHRLICGDSTDITVIDRLMDGVKAY